MIFNHLKSPCLIPKPPSKMWSPPWTTDVSEAPGRCHCAAAADQCGRWSHDHQLGTVGDGAKQWTGHLGIYQARWTHRNLNATGLGVGCEKMMTHKNREEWRRILRNWYIYILLYTYIYIAVCVYVCIYLYHIIKKSHRNVAGFSESMIWPFKFHGKSMTTGGLRFGKSKNDWQRWKMMNTGDSQHQKWWLKTDLESSKIIKIQYFAPLKSIQMEDQAANLWWIDEWIWLTVHFLGNPTTQWFRTAYSLLKLPLWGNYTPVSPGEIWM